MSDGLYIPSDSPTGGEFLPCRFRWPRGDQPYRRTVRAAYYRAHYLLPRFWLWLCVVVPPITAGRLLLPFDTWSLAQRCVTDAFLAATACLVAFLLDASLFGEIFDGQSHDPDSPCLARAAPAAYEWRREWATFESTPMTSSVRHFAGPLRFLVPVVGVEPFDLTPLVDPLDLDAFLERADAASAQFAVESPGTIRRSIYYNHRPARLVLTPIAAESASPQLATAHVWFALTEPDTANPGALQRIGTTYWFPGGKVSDRSTQPDDAAATIARSVMFTDTSLFLATMCALLVWPAGVLWLAVEAWREKRLHERYQLFRLSHSPYFGESLDLWLIQAARARWPNGFVRLPDEFQRRSQRAVERFKHFFAATGGSARGPARGGVR